MVKPQEIVLGDMFKATINKLTGRTEQQQVKETFQYILIGENLKLFLSQPGCMKCIIQEKRKVAEEGILHSYHDGLYWKQCMDGQIIEIDLMLYADDFETANPLG